jgi:hypothetical protein
MPASPVTSPPLCDFRTTTNESEVASDHGAVFLVDDRPSRVAGGLEIRQIQPDPVYAIDA